MRKLWLSLLAVVFSFPTIVLAAQPTTAPAPLAVFVSKIVAIVDFGLIPLLYALAFLFFLFGIARFFFSNNDEQRKKGKAFAIWGLVGLVVLFTVWSIVRLMLNLLVSTV